MNLKFKTMIFKIILVIYCFVLFAGCSSTTNTNIADNLGSSALSLDRNMFLSVMDESRVKARVYINNLTDQETSSIKYEVFTTSNNLISDLVLIDLNRCITLAPHSRCLLTFATSSLEYQPSLTMDNKKGDIQLANYSLYIGSDYILEVLF